ncbi:hypothetical protein SLA2020_272140 [Shorea laevis]
MAIRALKRVVSEIVRIYIYMHISIPKRCGTPQSPPRWQPSWACARSPHLGLGNGSDTIYNDPHHPHDTILSAFGSPKPDFPKRHPSWYYSRRRTFNCEVLISSWPARL